VSIAAKSKKAATTRESAHRLHSRDAFESHESNVRSYCRDFPAVFDRAKGAVIYDERGKPYIDFFAGAGTLNYGHNNDFIKERISRYLLGDRLIHALDFHTVAKREFIESFVEKILTPRNLRYKLQFCGPTGTNAVEAALKLARKATGRPGVFAFMGGYHGMSLGSLAATGNLGNRAGAGVQLAGVNFMPFPHGRMLAVDGVDYIDAVLSDTHSGIEKPAAILVETIQAEGGVNVAPVEWLRRLRALCDRYGVLLVCDDIQVGCYRSGPFFSFERADIAPDIVTLSKSISGYGLPMSLVLLSPEIDVWKPGEHTGTFRGNQLAFVGATAAIEFAETERVEAEVIRKSALVREFLNREVLPLHHGLEVRGEGLIWGIDCSRVGGGEFAASVSAACFANGLIAETCGRGGAVIKLLPPLIIEDGLLEQGLVTLQRALGEALGA
jgi:diaminobutyrate-2-oxoglutarate transaminase